MYWGKAYLPVYSMRICAIVNCPVLQILQASRHGGCKEQSTERQV